MAGGRQRGSRSALVGETWADLHAFYFQLWRARASDSASDFGEYAEPFIRPDRAKKMCSGRDSCRFHHCRTTAESNYSVDPFQRRGSGYLGVTDAEGHFHLEGIAAGNYDLTGERTGYLTSEYGARRPSGTGTTLNLKAGAKLTDVTVKVVRCSVIAGKITDDEGEPIRNAHVYAVLQQWLSRQLTSNQSNGVWTDDRGEYRMTDLKPGRYYLCVESSSESFVEKQGSQEMAVLSTCYPASRSPDGASQIEVQEGQDAVGLDMRMPVGPVFHIRGKLEMTASDRQQRLSLDAHLHNFGDGISSLDEEVDEQHGTFDFSGATPGDYDID